MHWYCTVRLAYGCMKRKRDSTKTQRRGHIYMWHFVHTGTRKGWQNMYLLNHNWPFTGVRAYTKTISQRKVTTIKRSRWYMEKSAEELSTGIYIRVWVVSIHTPYTNTHVPLLASLFGLPDVLVFSVLSASLYCGVAGHNVRTGPSASLHSLPSCLSSLPTAYWWSLQIKRRFSTEQPSRCPLYLLLVQHFVTAKSAVHGSPSCVRQAAVHD